LKQAGGICTPPWRIRLKTHVDHADQTTRIYTQKYVKIRQNGCAYYFKGIKFRRLITKINTRFKPDAPRWCSVAFDLLSNCTVRITMKAKRSGLYDNKG